MPHTVANMVRKWSRELKTANSTINIDKATPEEISKFLLKTDSEYPSKYQIIESQIDFLSSILYKEYEVTNNSQELPYPYRLRDWLNNVENENDKKTLFELAPKIFFIGQNEFSALYQSSFNGPIAHWLIDQDSIDICDRNAQKKLRNSLASTWFCAITDSMQIAKFYHSNQLNGSDIRPDFRALSKLSDKDRVINYMRSQSPKLKRIVLLEDFIATGSQMRTTVEFAATLHKNNQIPVLLTPLVICKSGYKSAQYLAKKHKNISFEPTLVLDDSIIIPINKESKEDKFIEKLRKVILKTYSSVCGETSINYYKPPYGPFGYGANTENGGLIVVLYTNCPDNTLPLIHYNSNPSWKALFPRSSRL